MKKSSYRVPRAILPVEQRETVDITTGELSQMAVPAPQKHAAFAYLFMQRWRDLAQDPRMTGEVWDVFVMLVSYVEYNTNQVGKRLAYLAQELGIQKQHFGRAVRVLREIGVVLPSQSWGAYHLSADVVYRGELHLRKRLLQRGVRKP